MPQRRFLKTFLLVLALLALSTLGACNDADQSADEARELTASDFGVPAGAESAGEHDDGHEHSHDDEPEEPVFDPSLTETGEEGVFIDHHGNRIVDELYQKYEQDGLQLEFTVENFLGVGGRGGEVSSEILAGERALIKFKVSQVATGEPISGLRPAAWLDLQSSEHEHGEPEEQEALCQEKVEGFLSGMLTARPTVDLNSFFILALNDDASISVIDPTVDVAGMTQLFALIQLAQPGEDWALSSDQERLFVTIPSGNQIAVAEMDGFELAHHLDGGVNPVRIAFGPDERYLWAGNDATARADSGVTVIDPDTLQTVAFIPTGAGHHELAFSPDGRTVFVTNRDQGTLSVIDGTALEEIAELDAGRAPSAVAYTAAAGVVYVADAASGTIFVFDGQDFSAIAEIETEPGLTTLAIAPDGRWALAVNPERGMITIIDATNHQVTHEAQVGGAPDQITFSEGAAYIRARDAALIYAIQLADLAPDSELELASVPVGQQAPGRFPTLPLAGAIHPASNQGAMVIANPADDQIYFYPEGTTASSGSFQGHGLFPRAVTIVDRSLREDAPGVYTGRLRVPAEGNYLVALMLNDPLLAHCFEFNAKHNEALDEPAAGLPELTFSADNDQPVAGQPFVLQFTLTDPQSGSGIDGLNDVVALATQVVGNWNTRTTAASLGDGLYEVQFTFPNDGLYTIFFGIPSLGLNVDRLPSLNLQVTGG